MDRPAAAGHATFALPTGEHILLRPIRPDDAPRL